MHQFKDTKGRSWNLGLNFASAKRLRSMLDIDIFRLEMGEPPLITRIGTDIILLCDIIYVMIKPQADSLGVNDEQFGESLGGEGIAQACTAFYGELQSFFQSASRTDLAKIVEKQVKIIKLSMSRVEAEVDRLDIEKKVNETIGKLSTSLQEESESTPTP